MRIVYCVNTIRYLGGLQRVTMIKANALADVPGNEVYVVVTDNKAGVEVDKLSSKVHLVDLDINYYKHDHQRSRLANIVVDIAKRCAHKKALKRLLFKIKPDVVISTGLSEKYMVPLMRRRTWKIMREFHVDRKYRSIYANSKVKKIVAALSDFYDFNLIAPKYDRIVVLTEQDKAKNWKGWSNVEVVPNPVSFKCENPSSLDQKMVVSLGRLDPVKNFPSLINSFKIVAKRHPDWKLAIYGHGPQEKELQALVDANGLNDNVLLMGYSNNVREILNRATIYALSSISEAFALVLLEAMECGVPVVSYDCPCGPQEIIEDGSNGFLVPLNDEKTMADCICRLIEDEDLRKRMGAAAKETAQQYQVENITKRWMDLFNDLVCS